MSTNKWERQKERKTIAKTARIGNGGEEENKILNRGYIPKKGEKGRVRRRLSNEMCTRARARVRKRKRKRQCVNRFAREDKTDFIPAIFSQLSFHKSENILRGRYFSIAGNKTQNAFETASTAPPPPLRTTGALGTE